MSRHTSGGAVASAVFSLSAAFVGCEGVSPRLLEVPAHATTATPQCLDPKAPDYYFAPGQIDESRDDAFMRREWFRSYLTMAGAESLSCGEPKEAYRLLWLTPSRNAKIFTLKPGPSAWTLDVVDFGKELYGGLHHLGPAPKLVRTTKEVAETDLRRIQQELTLFDYWSAKQHADNPEMEDGYALVIEGRSGDKYRAITRVNVWDGAEQIACPMYDIARIMLPDPIRCARPVTVP